MPEAPAPEVLRAADRFHTVGDGVETWHSFSYGAHYDPDRIGFGPIMAINTEHVAAGRGYDVHRHQDHRHEGRVRLPVYRRHFQLCRRPGSCWCRAW